MQDYTDTYPKWNKSMKRTHKVLVPDMLPYHFALMADALRTEGYDVDVLKNNSRTVIDEGLKHVHNDTCYPCLCVVGQYVDALKSGKYDPDKTALLITQTGGGCRASNYLSLVRKAIRGEFPNVPILSINFSGLEKENSLPMTLGLINKFAYCILYGDTIMWCHNSVRPYEVVSGEADKVRDEMTKFVSDELRRGKFKDFKRIAGKIISAFAGIKKNGVRKIKVGIVGEIYVKYSTLGNNNLEQMLLDEGCEPIVPALLDFVMYTMLGKINDARMYGTGKFTAWLYNEVYKLLRKKQRKISAMLEQQGFMPFHDMNELRELADKVIDQGVKMGEGWLIPAEMSAFCSSGVPNIVCAQPFGCLPNHIVGKGTIRTLKRLHPDINIVAIDYDASASAVNRENRIKLMLSAAREIPAAREA